MYRWRHGTMYIVVVQNVSSDSVVRDTGTEKNNRTTLPTCKTFYSEHYILPSVVLCLSVYVPLFRIFQCVFQVNSSKWLSLEIFCFLFFTFFLQVNCSGTLSLVLIFFFYSPSRTTSNIIHGWNFTVGSKWFYYICNILLHILYK